MKELGRIFRFTKVLSPYYAGVAAFSILVAAMSQMQPLLTKPAIDEVTKLVKGDPANIKLVAFLAVMIFVTDVAGTFFSNIGGYIGDLLSAKLQRFMSLRYYEHILSLPQRYFDTQLSGKIINRMSRGISQISNFMQIFSNNFLQFIFSTVFSLAIIAYYSWEVAVMLFMLYPIFIFLTGKTSGKWQDYQAKINTEQDVASGRFAESIGQIRVVKSFLQEHHELSFFRNRFDTVVQTTRPQSKFWHKRDVLRRLVLNAIFLAVFAFIFIETAHGKYSISTMVLLIQYALLIRIPIFSISFLVDNTQRAIANSKDFFEVMDEQPDIIDRAGAQPLQITKAKIAFDHVDFGYDRTKQVLHDINVTIEPDTKVALVGESGEGKTTLTNLVLRLYEVTNGTIRIDDQDINQVTQASLRGAIGVVFQEPALFSGTIRENISYANKDATDEQVMEAAKAANAHEFVSKLENGYDTEIGERGLKLSGGQKQRIAIARALLKDAPILILDEATSSLDSKSERMVQEALERLMKGRTTLIIAHRLSTIQNVDQIITLSNGRVDEVGTPAKLSKSNGIYAQLLALQQGHSAKDQKKLKEYEIAG